MLAVLSASVVGAPFLAARGSAYFSDQAVKHEVRDLLLQAAKEDATEFAERTVGTVTIPEIVRLDEEAYVAIGHNTDVAEGVSSAPNKVFGRGLNTIVLVSGAVSNLDVFAEYGLPVDGSADVAELLLDLYLDGFHVSKDSHVDQPARLLSQLKGNFSFILYDASVQYLLVHRSAVADKLFWGLDDKDNTMLKLATVKANLTEFPAGCAFESKLNNGTVVNRMLNIKPENAAKRAIMAMAKVNSGTNICGMIQKSASQTSLFNEGANSGIA